MPEKCRTLQTRHGMGAPSEDHTTPPSSRTPSSRGFSRTPAPQRSRRRRRAAIQRRRDGQARGAAWAARLLSPAWRSGGAAQGAARRPLGPLLRPTAGQTRAGTSLSTILPGAIARSLALRSPARLTERSSDLKPDLHQRGSRTVPSALPRCLPAAVYPPLNGPCPFSFQRARFARFRGVITSGASWGRCRPFFQRVGHGRLVAATADRNRNGQTHRGGSRGEASCSGGSCGEASCLCSSCCEASCSCGSCGEASCSSGSCGEAGCSSGSCGEASCSGGSCGSCGEASCSGGSCGEAGRLCSSCGETSCSCGSCGEGGACNSRGEGDC